MEKISHEQPTSLSSPVVEQVVLAVEDVADQVASVIDNTDTIEQVQEVVEIIQDRLGVRGMRLELALMPDDRMARREQVIAKLAGRGALKYSAEFRNRQLAAEMMARRHDRGRA